MVGILSLLYKAYFFLLFTVTLVLFYPFFWVTLVPENKNFRLAFQLKRIWARVLFYGSFNRVRVEGAFPQGQGPFIITPNHSSYFDIIVSYVVFTEPFLFMGKAELLKWPLFNIFFKYMDIAVFRQDPVKAARSMVKARVSVREGNSLVIFPEGTISKIAPRLRGFKPGAFKIAADTNSPIVPVTFVGNHKVINVNSWTALSRPGKVKVCIHDSISPKSFEKEELRELSEAIKHKIESKLYGS
ncbi:lysophospholipid acyltransferase family protein [Luteibaculum oceani]|nr:lysophospholipid acyltransferase family protein [Luteibaculum oceani]